MTSTNAWTQLHIQPCRGATTGTYRAVDMSKTARDVQAVSGGRRQTAVKPHDNVVRLRIISTLEEVKEEVFRFEIGIKVASEALDSLITERLWSWSDT